MPVDWTSVRMLFGFLSKNPNKNRSFFGDFLYIVSEEWYFFLFYLENGYQKMVPLRQFSVFKTGGNADYFAGNRKSRRSSDCGRIFWKNDLPLLVIGGGTNILFSDEGFRGLVIKMKNEKMTEEGEGRFFVESGKTNTSLYKELQKRGRDFRRFYYSRNHWRSYRRKFWSVGTNIENIFERQKYLTYTRKNFEMFRQIFSLRTSANPFPFFPEAQSKIIVWSVLLHIPEALPEQIVERAENILEMRRESEVWGRPGGSIFRSLPNGDIRISLDSFRGRAEHGVTISKKNPNFFKSQRSFLSRIFFLARNVAQEVERLYGIHLQAEVRILDQYGQEIPLFEPDFSSFSSSS